MTTHRSNARLFSNVQCRMPTVEARHDESFRRSARTREAILALNPWIQMAIGIDWPLARAELTPDQLEVLRDHFACPACGRWDRWPVAVGKAWKLSRTPLGCLCSRARDSDCIDLPLVRQPEVAIPPTAPEAAPAEQVRQKAQRRILGSIRSNIHGKSRGGLG